MKQTLSVIGLVGFLAACGGASMSQAQQKPEPKSFTNITEQYDLSGGLEDCKVYEQNDFKRSVETIVVRCLSSDVSTKTVVSRPKRADDVYQASTQTGVKGFFDENERRLAHKKVEEIESQIEELYRQHEVYTRIAESK